MSSNNYKAYIKNLIGTKIEIYINDYTTINELKKIIIENLYKNNIEELCQNFPYNIIYNGCKINKKYDLKTTMKELEISEETIFYVIDDIECKKNIEKSASIIFTPSLSLSNSKKNNTDNKKHIQSYSDGCFKSLKNPSLSPSNLILDQYNNTSSRQRYNSISTIDNTSNDILGISNLSLIDNSEKTKKIRNREYILSKFHPPKLNKSIEGDKILDDNKKSLDLDLELDESRDIILKALQEKSQHYNDDVSKKINESLYEIKNIKLSQSIITQKFEKTQEYMLEIKKELENNKNQDNIQMNIDVIKENFIKLNNSNVVAINNNTDVNNTILSYLKKINSETNNIIQIKKECSKQINEQIDNKFAEKILQTYKNIIKDKEQQLHIKQHELYISKGLNIFSSGLLIVLLFFQIIFNAYK